MLQKLDLLWIAVAFTAVSYKNKELEHRRGLSVSQKQVFFPASKMLVPKGH